MNEYYKSTYNKCLEDAKDMTKTIKTVPRPVELFIIENSQRANVSTGLMGMVNNR